MSSFDNFVALFSLTLSPFEIVVRGTAVYWFLFVLFRFVMRRDAGSIAMADLLLLILIADAAQNAMAGEYKSIADGSVLIATLAAWNYLLDWCSYRFPALRRVLEAKPLLLITDGRPLRANMRREFITLEEIESKLREAGVSRMTEVHKAYLESDGEISLLLQRDLDKGAGDEAPSLGAGGRASGTNGDEPKRQRRPSGKRAVP